MLAGRNFVAHVVFSINENAPPTIIRNNFRATVARTASGEYTVTETDDCAEIDATCVCVAGPNGGVASGAYVGCSVKRFSATTYKILLTPANTADAPGVGFPVAPIDPTTGTVITFTLDRVDTV